MTGRLIYLHGFASGPGSKKAQFFREKFAQAGIVMEVPDLAEGDFERLTISRQLGVVERLAAGDPMTLIGSSLGGYLAALYAARHPEVARLVLLAPAFGFARRWAESLGEQQMEQWKRTGSLPVYHYGEGRTRAVGYELYEDGQNYEDHPEVRQPALVFHGLQDTVVSSMYSVAFAQGRPNVEVVMLPSGHELVDVLDVIWDRMIRFLNF